MLRRINKQSCRKSLQLIQQKKDEYCKNTIHQGSFTPSKTAYGKGLHKKYCSTFSPMGENPLYVKRQILRKKEQEKMKVVPREVRVRLKQPTEHFNLKYMQWMRFRKQGMSWIQYNMTMGVAFLWKKVQSQIQFLQKQKNVKYNQNFQQQIISINQEIDGIIQVADFKIPKEKKEEFTKVFGAFNHLEFKAIPSNLAQIQKNINSKNFEKYYKTKQNPKIWKKQNKNSEHFSTANATPQKGKGLSRIKESVCKLNSYFCLFKRKITMKKEDNLVNEFFQRRSSCEGKLSPSDMQELEKIMKINQERCELMNQIISNITLLKSHQGNILLNQSIMKKIGEIDLIKNLGVIAEEKRQEVVKNKLKAMKNLVFQIVIPPSVPAEEIQAVQSVIFNQSSSNFDQRPKKKKINYRSSIQSFVGQRKDNYAGISSKISEKLKEKTNHKTNKLIKEQTEKPKKNDNQAVLMRSTPLKKEKSQKFENSFIEPKERERKTKKKTLAFASGYPDDGNVTPAAKSFKSKIKSAYSIKSKKEITWEDLERNQCRSLRSVKSLKSLRSIGSSCGSSKYLRSLKTQREMKYLHGRLRQIEYASKLRTKLFKLGGLQDDRPPTTKDLLDLTAEDKESSQSQSESLSIDKAQRNSHEESFGEQEEKLQTSKVTKSKSTIKHQPEKHLRRQISKISQNYEVYSCPSQKQNFLRDFFSKIGNIEKEINLVKLKSLILNELEKMLDGKIIIKQVYHKYKAYFQSEKKEDIKLTKLFEKDEEGECKKQAKDSIYSNLLNFRKLIVDTTELNQINKYYYNISQFQCEQEQIKNTKQLKRGDDFFFNIRNSIGQKDKKKRQNEYHFQSRKERVLQGLCQKGL